MRIPFTAVIVLASAWLVSAAACSQDTPVYFSPDPGVAQVEVRPDGFALWNAALSMSGLILGGHVEGLEFRDLMVNGTAQERMLPFVLLLGDGSVVPAMEMKIAAAPKVLHLEAQPGASRHAERFSGKAVVVELEDDAGRLHVTWRVILRDGSN